MSLKLFILTFLNSCRIQDDRTETYLNAIKSNYSHELQMVVTILTTNRKDRYDAIKKLCCLEKPGRMSFETSLTLRSKEVPVFCTSADFQSLKDISGYRFYCLKA